MDGQQVNNAARGNTDDRNLYVLFSFVEITNKAVVTHMKFGTQIRW